MKIEKLTNGDWALDYTENGIFYTLTESGITKINELVDAVNMLVAKDAVMTDAVNSQGKAIEQIKRYLELEKRLPPHVSIDWDNY